MWIDFIWKCVDPQNIPGEVFKLMRDLWKHKTLKLHLLLQMQTFKAGSRQMMMMKSCGICLLTWKKVFLFLFFVFLRKKVFFPFLSACFVYLAYYSSFSTWFVSVNRGYTYTYAYRLLYIQLTTFFIFSFPENKKKSEKVKKKNLWWFFLCSASQRMLFDKNNTKKSWGKCWILCMTWLGIMTFLFITKRYTYKNIVIPITYFFSVFHIKSIIIVIRTTRQREYLFSSGNPICYHHYRTPPKAKAEGASGQGRVRPGGIHTRTQFFLW